MLRYPLNGRPTAFFRGDWFVGKGVAHARIRTGPLARHVVEVFNTHTHAGYGEGEGESYLCHRTAQAWEMGKLLRGAAERGHLVLGLGDFNMVPSSLAHRIVRAQGRVLDVWRVVHPDSAVGPVDDPAEVARGREVPTADFNVRENGVTSNSVYNTWRWSKEEKKKLGPGKDKVEVPSDRADPRGQRLDYIFAGYGYAGDTGGPGGVWAVKNIKVGMMERHPVLGCSLSDHFSVEATLVFRSAGDPREMDTSKRTETALRWYPYYTGELAISTYDEMLAVINQYVAREKTQQKWRGLHFFAWVMVLVASLAAVWFVPRNFVAFILMLLSSLGLVAGTVDGLIALLFVNTELGALKEFEWEILNARAAAGGPTMVDGLGDERK